MATRGLPAWPLSGTQADDLPEAERLLLDAVRRWFAGGPAGPMREATIVLAAVGLEGAALLLDGVLRALPSLCAQPELASTVAPREAAFLLALAEAQRGRRHTALALLQGLAPPHSAHAAWPALGRLAGALWGGGCRLAERL
jgi:hypothetical protein